MLMKENVATPEKSLLLTVSSPASIRPSEPQWAGMKAVLQKETKTEIFQKSYSSCIGVMEIPSSQTHAFCAKGQQEFFSFRKRTFWMCRFNDH